MASLENVQGQFNSQDVNLAGMSASNDPLQVGADALARGRQAGFSDEETLGVLSRRRNHQRPVRMDNRERAQAQQRYSTIDGMTSEPGRTSGGEPAFKGRQVPNSTVQFTLDGGERDQSAQDAYYGRDENEFSRYNRDTGEFQDVYIPDGRTTPDDLRDEAILRSWGISRRKTGVEEVLDKRGAVVTNQQGEVMFRNTYDFENTSETTAGQGWTGGGGRAAADAVERLDGTRTGSQFSEAEVAERLRRMYGDNIPAPVAAKLRENLRRTADPSAAKAQEKREASKAVILSGMNFGSRMEHDDAYYDQIRGASKNVNLENAEYLPGSLTKTYADPEGGITIGTAGEEPDHIFAARPQAVQLSGEAIEIARALGDDVSGYVDLATGEGVQGVTPARVQTNLPNTSQQVNAPVTTAASWVAQNLSEGKTGDVLRDTNMSQITADFSRRVEANAPGYRSRPVRTVEDFATQVQRVIDARQGEGKNFYEPAFDEQGQPIRLRSGRQKQTKVTDPGISDVLRLLRMTSGEQGQLANSLYSMSIAGNEGRKVSSFSPGVSVNMGSMFGEKTDLGVAGRDTQRAAFARGRSEVFDIDEGVVDLTDAQRPQIGAVRERDEFGGVTREEPPLKRAVMKGRTPDEAVATYTAQREKNGQPVDPVYAEKIRRENASLRADQAKLEEDRAVARATEGGRRFDEPRAEAEFEQQESYRSERRAEMNEKAQLVELMKRGASQSAGFDLGSNIGGRPRVIEAAPAGRRLELPAAFNGASSAPEPQFQARNPAVGGNGVKPPSPPPSSAPAEATPAGQLISAFTNERQRRAESSSNERRKSFRERLGGRNARIGGYGALGAGGIAGLAALLNGREEN